MAKVVILCTEAVPVLSVEQALEHISKVPYGSVMVNVSVEDINDERLLLNNTVTHIHEGRELRRPVSHDNFKVTPEFIKEHGLSIKPHHRLLSKLTYGHLSCSATLGKSKYSSNGDMVFYRCWLDTSSSVTQWTVDTAVEIPKHEFFRSVSGTYVKFAIDTASGALCSIKYPESLKAVDLPYC